jgi:nicotinate-nucleotide adenylyltransferase
VVVRPGSDIPGESAAADLLSVRAAESVDELYNSANGRILVLELPLMDVSATGIRERIAHGRSPRYLIPDSVWRRIRDSGLYGA